MTSPTRRRAAPGSYPLCNAYLLAIRQEIIIKAPEAALRTINGSFCARGKAAFRVHGRFLISAVWVCLVILLLVICLCYLLSIMRLAFSQLRGSSIAFGMKLLFCLPFHSLGSAANELVRPECSVDLRIGSMKSFFFFFDGASVASLSFRASFSCKIRGARSPQTA